MRLYENILIFFAHMLLEEEKNNTAKFSGCDISGVVVRVGSAVSRFKPGKLYFFILLLLIRHAFVLITRGDVSFCHVMLHLLP